MYVRLFEKNHSTSSLYLNLSKATPHNSRLKTYALFRRPLHANRVEKMLVDTSSSNCAFFLALGAHWPVIRHAELCSAALRIYGAVFYFLNLFLSLSSL
jgi:hypothetical protein